MTQGLREEVQEERHTRNENINVRTLSFSVIKPKITSVIQLPVF